MASGREPPPLWGLLGSGLGISGPRVWGYLHLPNPTLLSGPYKLHIRVRNKNLQKSRVWQAQVRVGVGVGEGQGEGRGFGAMRLIECQMQTLNRRIHSL